MIQSVDVDYIHISIYDSVSGSSYIPFPVRLRNSKKVLIRTINNDCVFVGVMSGI